MTYAITHGTKGDNDRKSRRKMKTRMGGKAFEDTQERGAAKGEALFAPLLARFPDPDAAIKERKARWAQEGKA
jgi:hypothetical protein